MGLYSVNYSAYNTQKAMGYIAYMTAASYFKETPRCRQADALRLHYAEMDEEQQCKKETYADKLICGLGEDFLSAIADLKCSLHVRREGKYLRLYFLTGGFEGLICTVDPKGHLTIEAVPAQYRRAAG